MSIQATQFAATFERLGRRMLTQLASLPEELWDRTPPIPPADSLLGLATRLLDESEYWVLVTIGGQEMGGEHSGEACSPGVRMALFQRYGHWITRMHRVLGHLPDAIMNLFVAVPPAYRETFGAESITVHACLLYVLEQSGLLVGRIECLGQAFAQSEYFPDQVIATCEVDRRPARGERDARDNRAVPLGNPAFLPAASVKRAP